MCFNTRNEPVSLNRDDLLCMIAHYIKVGSKKLIDERFRVTGPHVFPADENVMWLNLDHMVPPPGQCSTNSIKLLVSDMLELSAYAVLAHVDEKVRAANSELVAFIEGDQK